FAVSCRSRVNFSVLRIPLVGDSTSSWTQGRRHFPVFSSSVDSIASFSDFKKALYSCLIPRCAISRLKVDSRTSVAVLGSVGSHLFLQVARNVQAISKRYARILRKRPGGSIL